MISLSRPSSFRFGTQSVSKPVSVEVTPSNSDRINQVLAQTRYKNWRFDCQDKKDVFAIRFLQGATQIDPSQNSTLFVSPTITTHQLVKDLFSQILKMELDAISNQIRYKGQTIFSAVPDVNALVAMCRTRPFDKREPGKVNPNIQNEATLNHFLKDLTFQDTSWTVGQEGERLLAQVQYNNPGQSPHENRGRKWYFSKFMTNSEVIQSMVFAILTAEQHEIRKAFHYQDEMIFGPHWSLEARLQANG